MDFIDLKTQQKNIKEMLGTNIQKVLAHGNYIMGPEIKQLEEKLASFVGTKHAIACASGTDALLLALMTFCILIRSIGRIMRLYLSKVNPKGWISLNQNHCIKNASTSYIV